MKHINTAYTIKELQETLMQLPDTATVEVHAYGCSGGAEIWYDENINKITIK